MSGDNEVKDYGPNKAVVNAAVDWTRLRLSEQVKHLRFFRDRDNQIVVFAVMPFDSTQPGGDVLPIGKVGIADPIMNTSYARCFGLPCCGWPETTVGLVTHSTQMVQKNSMLEAQRTPTIFSSAVTASAAAVTVWLPAGGRRFRLMGGVITFAGPILAAAAATIITLLDEVAAITLAFGAWIPTAATYIPAIPFDLKPNGYLSTTIDNRLQVTLSANLTGGNVRVTVWGTEEV